MDCRITSTKAETLRRRGATLLDTTFGILLTSLLVVLLVTVMMFTSQSFAAIFNYSDLEADNRIAIDQLTRDVRQANRVITHTATRLELEDSDGQPLIYVFDGATMQVARIKAGERKVLLKECQWLRFVIGQRNPVSGSFDVYPAATPATAKVVNVSWVCGRKLKGQTKNTESVQTARIVIRKQGST